MASKIVSAFEITQPAKLHINEDINGCIKLAENELVDNLSKNVDLKYQVAIDNVNKGNIVLRYIHTSEMIANIMAKPLECNFFTAFVKKLCFQ